MWAPTDVVAFLLLNVTASYYSAKKFSISSDLSPSTPRSAFGCSISHGVTATLSTIRSRWRRSPISRKCQRSWQMWLVFQLQCKENSQSWYAVQFCHEHIDGNWYALYSGSPGGTSAFAPDFVLIMQAANESTKNQLHAAISFFLPAACTAAFGLYICTAYICTPYGILLSRLWIFSPVEYCLCY